MWMPSIPNVRAYLAQLHFTPAQIEAWFAAHPETPDMPDVASTIPACLEEALEALPDHSTRGHSPLGASGAERWMNCPGSIALLRELEIPEESDEPDYRREGTALHEAAAYCLEKGLDTWEIVGQEFNRTVLDTPMCDAIQMYLDKVRPEMVGISGRDFWVEYPISSPVHKDFYGSVDFGAKLPERLVVTDLKGGEGIIVDPDDNPQLKYYAFGLIDTLERQDGLEFGDEFPVLLRIVQPRAFSQDGPVREWETTVGALKEWVHDTLVPAMARTEYDDTLEPGPWCRFCPAKLVCPMMQSLFGAAAKANPRHLVNLSDEALSRAYRYAQAVRMYLRALEDRTYERLNSGASLPDAKLVEKKANRVFKSGADAKAKRLFGKDALTTPQLKSPAELEKLSPKAREFVTEYAYTPKTGLTVAPAGDRRGAVKVTTTTEAFGSAVAKLTEDKA
jgi:hypothetical protein